MPDSTHDEDEDLQQELEVRAARAEERSATPYPGSLLRISFIADNKNYYYQ